MRFEEIRCFFDGLSLEERRVLFSLLLSEGFDYEEC